MRLPQLFPLLASLTLLVDANINKTERSRIEKRDIFADVNRLQVVVQQAVQVVVVAIQQKYQSELSQAGVNIYLPGETETGLLFIYSYHFSSPTYGIPL